MQGQIERDKEIELIELYQEEGPILTIYRSHLLQIDEVYYKNSTSIFKMIMNNVTVYLVLL